ncbi:MAG: hypothetical protein GSR79_03855 [Desulfurococcales archaeon]|nr:hypothetical protein [Desulfurococcales archaeon]
MYGICDQYNSPSEPIKIVIMYIWIPSFIKPSYVPEKGNSLGTDNIVTTTPNASIWPESITRIEVTDK